jgi:hypothetical protein
VHRLTNVRWNELTLASITSACRRCSFNTGDFETRLSGSTEEAFKLAGSNAAAQVRIVESGAEKRDLPEAA